MLRLRVVATERGWKGTGYRGGKRGGVGEWAKGLGMFGG